MNFFSHIKKIALTAILVVFPILSVYAHTSYPSAIGFVNDFGSILTPDQVKVLETSLSEFEKRTGSEIAVVTIKSLEGDSIEEYAVALFDQWGIGKKGEDNGVLLLIAIEDRKMRIEVGYGLEPVLTDAESSHIVNRILTPAFKDGDYYEGISQALERMQQVISGEVAASTEEDISEEDDDIPALIFIGFFFLMYIGSILARSKSWWGGGLVGGVLGTVVGFIYGFVYIGIIAIALLILFGLLFDFIVSSTYRKNVAAGHSHPWWIGGGGSSGSSGSFGGFGGGSSGGGGASGSW